MSYSSTTNEPRDTTPEESFWQAVDLAVQIIEAQEAVSDGRRELAEDDVDAVQTDLDWRLRRVIDDIRSHHPEDLAEQLALFMCVAGRSCEIHEPDAEVANAVTAQARRWCQAADPGDPRTKLLIRLLDLPSLGAGREPNRTSAETPRP